MSQLECKTKWTGELGFEAEMRSHKLQMDTKPSDGSPGKGPTPKEILLASICACSGIDVVSILQKMRLDLVACDVNAVTETTKDHPSIFSEAQLQYRVQSSNAKPEQVMKAVNLSMTKYCGVSAMVAPLVPLVYHVFLNDIQIGEGQADFTQKEK